MLVLTRRQGESIAIGSDVVVTVLEIRGGQVRLGIAAPPAVTVLRSEITEQLADSDQQPGASAPDRAKVPTAIGEADAPEA